MDIGTVIGLVGTFTTILIAMLLGGSPLMFLDIPSVMVVVVGTITVTFIKYPLDHTLMCITIALKAFFHKTETEVELIEKAVELASIARKDGLLGLESVQIENEFLGKGVQLAVDGQPPEIVRKILNNEINLSIERHARGNHIFIGIGDTAPAMGMVGTLIGLVQMMSNMSDPSSIGPAMAVALLTTLYGAVIANVIALPIADKLDHRSKQERKLKTMVLETVSGIQNGVNPKVLQSMLNTYLKNVDRLPED